MKRIARYGFAAAITILGLSACADSATSTESRAADSKAGAALATEISPGTQLCKPCPPGQVCAAVCEDPSEDLINPGGRRSPDAPRQ